MCPGDIHLLHLTVQRFAGGVNCAQDSPASKRLLHLFNLVAGSFLYTVGFALLKEMYAHEKGSIIFYVVLGFVSILAGARVR